ncbi:MAG TPA: DUF5671 domain-containing protein, partial [Chloroflexota bacterium]|nr:DUF5671 domain-containing protein [Chloroflexota bacterium]
AGGLVSPVDVARPAAGGLVSSGQVARPATGGLLSSDELARWRTGRSLMDRAVGVDGGAVSRSLYLFAALAVGVIGTLSGASQLLFYAVGRLLGVDHPGGVGGDLLAAAAGPLSAMVVYGVSWAYHRAAVQHQERLGRSTGRQVGVQRLYTYLVALVALVVWATGLGGLLWLLGEPLLGLSVANPSSFRESMALFATLTIVGFPVWLRQWQATPTPRPTEATDRSYRTDTTDRGYGTDATDSRRVTAANKEGQAAADSQAGRERHLGNGGQAGDEGQAGSEAQSLARRLYLYVSLLGATLALVGSAAAALYRVLGLVLGEPYSAQVLTDLAHGVALALVAGLLAGYHWRALRHDTRGSAHILPVPTNVSAHMTGPPTGVSATTAPASADASPGVSAHMTAPPPTVSATTGPASAAAQSAANAHIASGAAAVSANIAPAAAGVSATTPTAIVVEIRAADAAAHARALAALDSLRASGLDVTIHSRTSSA